MLYKTRHGDSPARIARAYGLPLGKLIAANPHKPTHIVNGERTWRSIFQNETVHVPRAGGFVGDIGVGASAAETVGALIAAGGPCLQSNVLLVCAVQRALGVAADGKYGNDTATAAKRITALAPSGCSPRPSWWAPVGQSNCTAASLPAAPPVFAPPPAGIPAAAAPAAVMALAAINPCDPSSVPVVCAAQAALRVAVDGKYGNDTSTAARRVFPGAPAGCNPRPTWWKPAGQSNCVAGALPVMPVPPPIAPPLPFNIDIPIDMAPPVGVPVSFPVTPPVFSPPVQAPPVFSPPVAIPASAPPAAPAAVMALLQINPCDPANVGFVCQAQAALGFTVGGGLDGKYGNDTAARARQLLPNAPGGCSPRPSWWAPTGYSNCPGAAPPPAIVPPPSAPPVTSAPPSGGAPAPGAPAPGGGLVVPEQKKGLSTGAIVAGGVGLVALIGLVALAATGKKGTRGGRGQRGPRGPARRKKPAAKRKGGGKKRK